jgi:hypothetical protein
MAALTRLAALADLAARVEVFQGGHPADDLVNAIYKLITKAAGVRLVPRPYPCGYRVQSCRQVEDVQLCPFLREGCVGEAQ